MAGDDNTNNTALEWARESLRRRREELARDAMASASRAAAETCSPGPDDGSVGSLLQRGQALLAEAQLHNEILGRYVRVADYDGEQEKGDNDGHSARDGGSLSDLLRETQHGESELRGEDDSNANEDASENVSFLTYEIPVVDESTGEGDKARLDELIAQVRQQDDDPPAATPPRRVASFDPSALKSSTRAQFRRARLDKETAQADEEMLRLSSFKALPMPDNTPVKNNPLASTKAFECRTASLKKLVRRDHVTHGQSHTNDASSVASTFGSFDMAGSVATATSLDESLLQSEYYVNDEDFVRARQVKAERKARKQDLLDEVNETIVIEGTEDDATTVCQGGDYLEDPSTVGISLVKTRSVDFLITTRPLIATATDRQAASQAETDKDSEGAKAERHCRHRPERPVRSSLGGKFEPGREGHRESAEEEGVRKLGQLPTTSCCDRGGPPGSLAQR